MISNFLVHHPPGPFFSLSTKEYDQATRCYPDLLSDSIGLCYDGYSARAGINVGKQGYFDNDTILCQFERLFQLLQFKEEYQGHDIEVVVDNARNHSAKEYSINDFGKGVDTKCHVDAIEFVDHQGQLVSVWCYFENDEHKGKSKGLLRLANDLQVPIHSSIKLSELRTILSKHPAFQNVTKLEKLAHKYNVKVIFVPKFHCELNPIEGLWCHMKQFVRKKTDQTFSTMMRLIPEFRENFVSKEVQLKLFRRFWRSLNAYQQGKSYGEVLRCFFSGHCNSNVTSH